MLDPSPSQRPERERTRRRCPRQQVPAGVRGRSARARRLGREGGGDVLEDAVGVKVADEEEVHVGREVVLLVEAPQTVRVDSLDELELADGEAAGKESLSKELLVELARDPLADVARVSHLVEHSVPLTLHVLLADQSLERHLMQQVDHQPYVVLSSLNPLPSLLLLLSPLFFLQLRRCLDCSWRLDEPCPKANAAAIRTETARKGEEESLLLLLIAEREWKSGGEGGERTEGRYERVGEGRG